MRGLGIFALILAGLVLITPQAHASELVLSPGTATIRTGDGFTLGLTFTVGSSDVSVTALEVWDFNQDGLSQSMPVAIWNSSGGIVASTTVDSGTTDPLDPLDAEFREKTITPVTLTAGKQYFTGVYYSSSDTTDKLHDHAATLMSFDFSGYAGVFSTSNTAGSITEPTNQVTGEYIGPNFVYTVLPEPSCLVLGLGGLVVLSGRLRTRR
jgi:hypothetical protein